MDLVYTLSSENFWHHAVVALNRLSKHVDEVIVVAPNKDAIDFIDARIPDNDFRFVKYLKNRHSFLNGYKSGLADLLVDQPARKRFVCVTGDHIYPVDFNPHDIVKADGDSPADLYSSYSFDPSNDSRFVKSDGGETFPLLDFAIFSPKLVNSEHFRNFWDTSKIGGEYWSEFTGVLQGIGKMLRENGYTTTFFSMTGTYETYDPRMFEIHKIAQEPYPVLTVSAFNLDGLLYDIYAIDMAGTLATLNERFPETYEVISRHLLKIRELRDLQTMTESVEIFDDRTHRGNKDQWSFGQYGVFIHAFYASMMPEFWALIERLPGNFKLYLSTASREDKEMIEKFLADKGLDEKKYEVRVVAVNRGRDMSSLFITFRDVIMNDAHDVCLRLHSKRTPQVARQIGESFKNHLFENLVASSAYVGNVLDYFEQNPNAGLLIPTTVHIGFGTLGHAWFVNKAPMMALAHEMGIDVPFDTHTPLAPFGTMYWFRSDALRQMFDWEWEWTQYNEEPMHVDGGLAHVQERLIPYAVQAKGYRVVSIMNPTQAARNYAKLEYKMQRLVSYLPSPNIIEQDAYLAGGAKNVKIGLRTKLGRIYQEKVMTRPWLLRMLRPIAQRVNRALKS